MTRGQIPHRKSRDFQWGIFVFLKGGTLFEIKRTSTTFNYRIPIIYW